MKNRITTTTLLLCLLMTASAQQPLESTLHLMQPEYGFPYGIPARDSVKADIDRVLTYLEATMPIGTENGRLKTGSFRLTSYESGVLYAAAEDAGKWTKDERYTRFTTDRLSFMAELAPTMYDSIRRDRNYDRQMRLMIAPSALDDAGAMCAAYCRMALMQNGGRPVRLDNSPYRSVIKCYMNQIWKQYRIGEDRIFARTRPHYNTVWLDDMYMGIPSLAWYGALCGDTASVRDAVGQIRAFKTRMWMPDQQLFRHGWVEEMNPHPFFPWGRANGWAILTMCEVLDAMQQNHANLGSKDYKGYAADHAFVLDLLRQHIAGLCRLQDKTGLWHQLLNEPSSYLETSATAIYTYCLAHAICEGWIDPLAYGAQTLLAWDAVSTQINQQGQVENTCVGSGMGFDAAFYCYRPVHPLAAHGYGPVIWAGGEIIRLLDTTHPRMNDSAIHFYPTEIKTSAAVFGEDRKTR